MHMEDGHWQIPDNEGGYNKADLYFKNSELAQCVLICKRPPDAAVKTKRTLVPMAEKFATEESHQIDRVRESASHHVGSGQFSVAVPTACC